MLNGRYAGAAFEEKFLPRLTSKAIQELPKENALIVLPVGAVEQHGPHLPVYTDTLIGEGLLAKTFEHFTADNNIWLLPPLPYGKSTEHLGMSGTITLSASTLQAVVTDIARSVKESGFKRLVLFNTHGGNHDLLNMISREIRIETNLMVFRLNSTEGNLLSEMVSSKELQYGIHGGEIETSMVLDFKSDWVKMEHSPVDFVSLPPENKHLYLKGGCYFAWVMNDISETGMAGDAKKATKSTGTEINDRTSAFLAEVLIEMSNFDINLLKKQAAIKN